MQKADKKVLTLKFLLILMLSNTLLFFTLNTESSSPSMREEESTLPRRNYLPIQIKANLRTVFDSKYPIQLVDPKTNQVIKDVFLLEKRPHDSGFIDSEKEDKAEDFLIHIHKEQVSKLNYSRIYDIFPASMRLKKRKRGKTYEMSY